MGLYNFKARFAPYILDGSKTHTIRGIRKYPDKPGNILHLYTGLCTKAAELLRRYKCVRVQDIYITIEGSVIIDGSPLTGSEVDPFFWTDGFRPLGSSLSNPHGAYRMAMKFWEGQLPFQGHIIHWNPEGRNASRD